MKNNRLIHGDTEFQIDAAYRKGAADARKGIPWTSDRFKRSEGKSNQYDYGHTNEANGVHAQANIDVVQIRSNGKTFKVNI